MSKEFTTHGIFPVMVTEHFYDKHEEFRDMFLDQAMKHFNFLGLSNEKTGHVTIHHEPEYEDLYRFLHSCVVKHLNQLHIDVDIYNVNFIKSWLNVLGNNATPTHAHRDAHISIVYYVNTPEGNEQSLRFCLDQNINDPYTGAIKVSNKTDQWNIFNSYTWSFPVRQGQVIVFPASLLHETTGDNSGVARITDKQELLDKRITIASDVLMNFKQKANKPLGIQPVENWRNFE
jgi:uncharacterized protein (TIGR02466 family)